MNPLVKWGGIALLIAGCAWTTLHFVGGHESKKSATSDAAATVQRRASVAEAAQGAADVQHAQDQSQQVAQVAAVVAREDPRIAQLQATVARLRAAQSRAVQPAGPPGTMAPEPLALPPETPLEVAKDQLIDGLTQENASLKTEVLDLQGQVVTLNDAVVNYQASSEDALKADTLRKIALDAQVQATRAARFKGDLEGGAAGVIAGLVIRSLLHF
jgi:hypothetical protein